MKQLSEWLAAEPLARVNKEAWLRDVIEDYKTPVPHKCPVCDGTKLVSRPPGVAGDVEQWSSNAASHPCEACNQTGIIWSRA